ncbi:hypothetical protein ABIC83_002753 [Roseateles asaccharophilus]|uniref:hypothetical protein n=1 Tax=Roseateles asaccharophilus TaxID=582607 RepID=UPI003839789E
MIRLEFNAVIDQIHRDLGHGAVLQSSVDLLLRDLLRTRAVWPRQAIMDMVYGEHGDDIAKMSARRMVEGLYPATGGRLLKHLDAESFAWIALTYGHGDLVKAIAQRGIPAEHLTRKSQMQEWALGYLNDALQAGYTRPAQALDLMANSLDILPLRSFPGLLSSSQSETSRPYQVDAGVKLLFEVAPTHPDIAHWQGTSLGAQFTQLQMLKQIAASVGHAGAPVAPLPTAANSTRRVL